MAVAANDGLGGSDEALGHVERATDALLHFRGDVETEVAAARASDPTCMMGHALDAYLHLLTTEPGDAAVAAERFPAALAPIARERLSGRERGHVEAVERLLAGDILGAGGRLLEVTRDHPRDAVALAVGHQLDFFTGDATVLRDRVGGALSAWSEDDRWFGPVLGMYAFGLEEAGHYDRSEEVALRAVELDGRDVWGIHAVAHTYEMQGRVEVGMRYLEARERDWAEGNFFTAHNWWHYCLYALEAGETDRALAIYDRELHHPGIEPFALRLLDAAALLWRLYLEGDDQTERWRELARAWEQTIEPAFYAFNDMHAVMAYVGAGEIARAERLVTDRRRYVETTPVHVTNVAMTRDVGIPVCVAFIAFGQGRYDEVVELLHPIRRRINAFGGSHAQRDAVYKTLLEATIRAGRLPLARTLASERLHVRPSSPYNNLKLRQIVDREAEVTGPG
jgi:hypothetical protein